MLREAGAAGSQWARARRRLPLTDAPHALANQHRSVVLLVVGTIMMERSLEQDESLHQEQREDQRRCRSQPEPGCESISLRRVWYGRDKDVRSLLNWNADTLQSQK